MTYREVSLCVLGRFQLTIEGCPTSLPVQAQRLLALLAVRPHQPRSAIAGTLWGDCSETRAQANLRNAVWLIRRSDESVLSCSRQSVGLDPGLVLDLAEAQRSARCVLNGGHADAGLIEALDQDLLPAWDEEWLIIDRERQRQLRMHALETLSETLGRAGRHPEAIAAALAAVRAEPLRESAQRSLIQAHVGEGNLSEAIRQLESYRLLLDDQLGIAPSNQLVAIIATALRAQCA